MSRSLSKDILETLKYEDPAPVYHDIAEVLNSFPEDGSLLEIELLGKAHSLEPGVNFLRDETAIAIPKLRLTQAFFVARCVIQKHIISQLKVPDPETQEATAVALLMDPEHMTAANIRKRFVLSKLNSDRTSEAILQQEKQFLDSLLTTRLHRHTKSPTLWNHRRWLMERFKEFGIHLSYRQDFSTIIMVAAERHPRNYYAWHHARWLISHANAELNAGVLMDIIDDTKLWCLKHHDDISGWSYLSFILCSIENPRDRIEKSSAVLTDILQMAESFRWANESLWSFLRIVLARDDVGPDIHNSLLDLNQKVSLSLKDDIARRHLRAAVQWADRYGQRTDSTDGI